MRKNLTVVNLLVFMCLAVTAIFAQERAEIVVAFADKQTPVTLYKGSYAMVIGVSDYTAGWDDLPGVKSDTEAVKSALEKQGFSVSVLSNPTERELDTKIHHFIKDHGYESENRLLIYFAGHGHTDTLADGRELGFYRPG